MSHYKFIVPTTDSKDWLAFRTALYHDLGGEIDNKVAQKFHFKASFEETYRVVEYKMKL